MRKNPMFKGIMLSLLVVLFVMGVAPISAQSQEEGSQQQQQQQRQQQQRQQQDPMMQGQQAPKTDFSDEEIAAFADALVKVEEIQQNMQSNFDSIIQEGKMESQRFQELHQHYTQTQGEFPDDATDQEKEDFNAIFEELSNAEQEVQQQMVTAVEEAGLDVETFNQIVMAAQQDPELWEKVQAEQGNKQGNKQNNE